MILAILSANNAYKKYQQNIFSEETGNVYFLQQGAYTDSSSIKDIKATYITVKQEKKYYTYVGMSTSLENALKIKNYYEKQNIPIFIKNETLTNKEFLSELSQYDILISSSTEEQLPHILETILSTYEEIYMTN